MSRRVAACSWSLRPESPEDLSASLHECGLRAVQLALNPITSNDWELEEVRAVFGEAAIEIISGMMETKGEDYSSLESIARTGGLRPDEHWSANRECARKTARLAAALDLDLVTFHAGFIPHEWGTLKETMIQRLREVANIFAEQGMKVGLETGQEDAVTLKSVLEEIDHKALGVNFDPANMILYGMGDPVEALEILSPWVQQIHIKDANPTAQPGTWGEEVPAGEGAVDWTAFFDVIRDQKLAVDLIIEREAGEQRVADILSAHRLVLAQLERIDS